MKISSAQIVYSEHDYDECFEYKDGSGRVPDGTAVGFLDYIFPHDKNPTKLILFTDVIYSPFDHDYWNNFELENDPDRLILP